MGKGGEEGVVIIGGPRRHSAVEAEEGSAKKMRAEAAEEVPAAPATATAAAAVAKTRKTKKVMRRLPQDYVDYILAKKPKEPARFPHPNRLSEECRRQSARVHELIRATHEHIRSIQEYYRRELDNKGYVEVEEEVEVSDDGF